MSCILGLDPGNTHSAAVMLENGRIVRMFRERNDEFLKSLQRIDAEFRNQGYLSRELRVVCEMPALLGKGVGVFWQIFETCTMVGRIQAIFPDMDRITRSSVKIAVCGKSGTNDKHVRAAMIKLYGEPGTMGRPGGTYGVKKDMWAALAVCTAAAMGAKLYDTSLLKQRRKKSKQSH